MPSKRQPQCLDIYGRHFLFNSWMVANLRQPKVMSVRCKWRDVDIPPPNVCADLARVGASADRRILLLIGNGLPFVMSFLGVTTTGATVVPTIEHSTQQWLEYTIPDSECAAVIVEMAYRAKAREICRRLNVPLLLVQSRGSSSRIVGEDPGGSSAEPGDVTQAQWDDVARIMYTSCTTNQPKGS